MPKFNNIFEAIRAEDVQAVRKFLKRSECLEEEGNWNPLHEAGRIGNPGVVEALLEYIHTTESHSFEFEVNSAFEIIDLYSDYRGTALSEALLYGNTDVARLLVENGADVNAEYYSQDQDTPEYFFGEHELATHAGVAWWLALDKPEILELMRKNDLEVDAGDYRGRTAIFHHVSSGSVEKTETLLVLGADPNQYVDDSDMGKTPLLIYAIYKYIAHKTPERIEIVKKVLQHGALLSQSTEDFDKETVMDIVIEANDPLLDSIFGLSNVRRKIGQINLAEKSKEPEKDTIGILLRIMKTVIENAKRTDMDEPVPDWQPPKPDLNPELSDIETSIAVALAIHKGQKDKAGAPYILHPLRVMLEMDAETEMIAAVLHDVVEDSNLTLEAIEKLGFDRSVVEAVASVTRREGEPYDDFVFRAGHDPIVAKIKAADIADNMNLNRIETLTQKDLERVQRYHRSLAVLKRLEKARKSCG